MKHNEDSRVKIPALIHLTRIGYTSLSLKELEWDSETNIITDIFVESFKKLNPSLTEIDALRELKELSNLLDNDDLGKAALKGFKIHHSLDSLTPIAFSLPTSSRYSAPS